ncbi:unnamed protein product [marine sediment metagenome]|uniref:Uncharacterized protein n=1 Tax=marine sediment metagenome TaxID=412755 RepID=X1TNL2_9ZZZZ
MKILKMEMMDPLFAEGESRTAIATFPVRPAGLACTAELWLTRDGTTRDATSGERAFTSTGLDQSISCPIPAMPAGGYEYLVRLSIKAEGTPIMEFAADESVLIPWVGIPTIEW